MAAPKKTIALLNYSSNFTDIGGHLLFESR